ncbi:heat shock 70 kDa protein 12B-like [Saccostrea echinata]|uniref:heat shock 70 kDa protein 12B-like n=1 Tax=Saccostrea echinata TaxID=191078 RepID=UPI002A7F6944|nr:heat shock 70 kDa protein 12B-like [Saccostrea echinata]
MSNRPVIQQRESNRPVVSPRESNRPVVKEENNRPVIGSKNDNMLMVAAIDFGTTFSGYAFSMRDNPKKIQCPHWNAPSTDLISHKTPTTVLLDGKKNFVAFGYEAETKYLELTEEKKQEANNYYYFRRFKMMLYDKVRKERLTTETKVSDIKGRELPAVEVFAHAIRYLKDHLIMEIESKDTSVIVKECNITWVLTVPAIWDDPAKQFMRKAAEKAGIESKSLVIALEPEAASIYCKELPVEKLSGTESGIGVFSPGKKYLVLDAGGGTIDMTVHEVKSGGKLHELSRASGGNWGGVKVDMTFKQMLVDIVGEGFMESYCHSNTAEYIELFRDFELKKRQKVDEKSQTKKITMKIPATFSDKYEEIEKNDISKRTKETTYGKLLKWEGDKLRINKDIFDGFFKPSCEGIVKHVKKLLADPKVKGTNVILMVGGFSESAIVQQAVKDAFPDCRVVIPHEAGLAVLKGAVLYGHDPSAVASRIAKFTYGIGCTELFDPQKHDLKRKMVIEGKERCSNIFSKHVEAGDVLYLNEEQGEHKYFPISVNQKAISFPLYTTEAKKPQYTDEPGCTYLGTLTMDISNTKGGLDREFTARLKFGGTELTVSARNVQTNETAHADFDFLQDEP